MALISEKLGLLFFATILIVSGVLAWWMGSYHDYDKGSFHTFIAILAGLGVFVTFMFYWNVISLQNQQQQLAGVQELARINDSLLESMLEEIKDASITIPNFTLSITPLTNTACCDDENSCQVTAPPDPVNPITCTQKMVLSYKIFSMWQDVLISNKFININTCSYVANFLQRANSPQLFKEWKASKINFDSKAQIFGDLLFEYGLPITIQTPEEYVKASDKLVEDPRYKELVSK